MSSPNLVWVANPNSEKRGGQNPSPENGPGIFVESLRTQQWIVPCGISLKFGKLMHFGSAEVTKLLNL